MGFWQHKRLAEMSEAEWESLCDGCGLCCQIRVEDEDTGEIALSDAACRLLDLCTHRCSDYANRKAKVPDCVKITPENVRALNWLPYSCAYRLLEFGMDLPDWHHLVCGDPERVHTEGPRCGASWSARTRSTGPSRAAAHSWPLIPYQA